MYASPEDKGLRPLSSGEAYKILQNFGNAEKTVNLQSSIMEKPQPELLDREQCTIMSQERRKKVFNVMRQLKEKRTMRCL